MTKVMIPCTIAGFEFDKEDVKPLTESGRAALFLILAGLRQYGAVSVDLDDSPESYELREFFETDSAKDYLAVFPGDDAKAIQDSHFVLIAPADPPCIHWRNGV